MSIKAKEAMMLTNIENAIKDYKTGFEEDMDSTLRRIRNEFIQGMTPRELETREDIEKIKDPASKAAAQDAVQNIKTMYNI